MTHEQKDLLLKDLCARLPYGVKCQFEDTIEINKEIWFCEDEGWQVDGEKTSTCIHAVKPYLFPLSSMTKEQYEEWCDLEANPLDEILTRNANGEKMSTLEHHLLIAKSLTDAVNYCYKKHFDIYGLIPMGLAIDATSKNIY